MKSGITKLMRNNYLALLMIVGLSFFLLGRIGFFLSTGSSFSALIWPAAGASLAFMLMFGYRVWPGIFLGALAFSISTFPAIIEAPFTFFNYPHLLVMSAGATLQTFVATWLVRKFNVADHDFSDPKKIGLFYCLVGPIACLTSASTAFLSFIFLGLSSFNNLAVEWLLWWGADSTSTIIFFTLFMAIFTFEKKRRDIVSIILTVGFIVTFGMLFVGRLWEQERMTLLFTQEVIGATDTLKQIEARHDALVNNLVGFKSFRETLKEEDFAAFVENNLKANKSVRSIAWIEFVNDIDRVSYEQKISNFVGEQRTIWHINENQLKVTASNESSYTSVSMIEPYEVFSDFIGLNISNDEYRMEAINNAIRHKRTYLTAPVILTTESGEPKAVTLYTPIYRDNELEGLFSILIEVDSLITEMISNSASDDLEVSMRDKNAPGVPFFNSARIMDGYIDPAPIVVEVTLRNRTWELLFRRTLNFINKNRTSQPLFIGMAGMIFSALVAIGIIILSGQRLFLEKLVRRRTLDLQKANLTKSEFMANMSHDLRTPLNAIIGFSDIMQKELYGKLGSDKYLEYSRDINHSSEYLLSLINDVLDYSALEANKRNIEKGEIDVKEIINDCIRTISPLSAKKKIRVTTDISDNLPFLMADTRSVKQIIINLLSNAIKFTPNNGKVTVVAQHDDKGHVLTISDNGKGIAEENIARILEPFARVESDPHVSQEGTGLGLSIVQSLLKLHDGTLEIDSKLGEGTKIIIRFP